MTWKTGSALLTLLVFMSAVMIVVSFAVAVIIANEQASLKYSLGEETLAMAEGGAENAVMRVLRDPTYVGETLSVGSGTVTITVTGTTTKTITADATNGIFRRRIQVIGAYNNAVFTVNTWNEIN